MKVYSKEDDSFFKQAGVETKKYSKKVWGALATVALSISGGTAFCLLKFGGDAVVNFLLYIIGVTSLWFMVIWMTVVGIAAILQALNADE